jgi:hypothetical protein
MTVPLYWRDQSLMNWTATVLAFVISGGGSRLAIAGPSTAPTGTY